MEKKRYGVKGVINALLPVTPVTVVTECLPEVGQVGGGRAFSPPLAVCFGGHPAAVGYTPSPTAPRTRLTPSHGLHARACYLRPGSQSQESRSDAARGNPGVPWPCPEPASQAPAKSARRGRSSPARRSTLTQCAYSPLFPHHHQAPCTLHQAPGTRHQAPGTRHHSPPPGIAGGRGRGRGRAGEVCSPAPAKSCSPRPRRSPLGEVCSAWIHLPKQISASGSAIAHPPKEIYT